MGVGGWAVEGGTFLLLTVYAAICSYALWAWRLEGGRLKEEGREERKEGGGGGGGGRECCPSSSPLSLMSSCPSSLPSL